MRACQNPAKQLVGVWDLCIFKFAKEINTERKRGSRRVATPRARTDVCVSARMHLCVPYCALHVLWVDWRVCCLCSDKVVR